MATQIKTLISFLLLLSGSPLSAQLLTAQILEDQSHTLYERSILFVGHSTSFWDGANTEPVVRKLIASARHYNVPVVATVAKHMATDPVLSPLHYFQQSDVDWLIYSRAGQHSLLLPDVQRLYVVGGNLGRCLCEGIRDLVRGIQASGNPHAKIQIYLVRDGMDDGYPPFSPMRQSHVKQFTKNFFVPSFNCPLQNWNDKKHLKLPDTRLDLYFNQAFQQSFDFEPTDDQDLRDLKKVIEVHFIASDKVDFNQ